VDSGLNALAFSPDNRRLAVGCRSGVTVWDVADGWERFHFTGHPGGWVWSVTFGPDGRRLACASGNLLLSSGRDSRERVEGGIAVRDLSNGKEVLTLQEPTRAVRSVAFSPDGKLLAGATGCYPPLGNAPPMPDFARGGEVKVWDATSGQVTFRHDGFGSAVAFSQAGLSPRSQGNAPVSVWELSPGGESRVAATRLTHLALIDTAPPARQAVPPTDDARLAPAP
jgi:WD40 repeat protein